MRRVLAATGLVAFVLALVPAASWASPVNDKQKQAAQLQAQIDGNGAKINTLDESYNAAVLRLEQSSTQIHQAEQRIADNQAKVNGLRNIVTQRATEVYKGANITTTDEALASADQMATKTQYAAAATGSDDNVMGQLNSANDQLNSQKADLQKQEDAASAEKSNLGQQRAQLQQLTKNQESLLAKTKGELAQLVEQVRQQKAAAASPRSGGGRNATPIDFPNVPAPSPGAAAAIAFAREQLGKPYQYAATGPDTYDCSGLTMMAWRAGGLSIPHYSGAQYAMFPKVGIDQLQPGDLVFLGAGGSQHVGLYIGAGLMIHAPQTGDVVKIASIGSMHLAVRPG